jgi:DNA mismatch repair protein MutL
LNIACTAAQQQAVNEHQSLLNEFGFELQPQDNSLSIKTIPIVLAQLDLNTMVSSVIDALNQKNINAISLGRHLLNLLHTTGQLQLQQAEQWLQNASPQQCIDQPWCRELDLLTLGSLFSD